MDAGLVDLCVQIDLANNWLQWGRNQAAQIVPARQCSTTPGASTSVCPMKSLSHTQPVAWPFWAWLSVVLTGVAAPVLGMVLIVNAPVPVPLALVGGPILAVGLMGVGMIAAAAAGRLWIGVFLAVLTGFGLILFAYALGMRSLPHPFSTGLAVIIASISFAARGALFARSATDKGWLIAGGVVGGEAAILLTAWALPDALPDWLLALLPAQWASIAIQTALTGTGTRAASSALFALAGTAAATLVVVWLWPRRWPYLLMFTAWLGFSALVLHRPAPPMPRSDLAIAAAPAGQIAPIAGALPDTAPHTATASPHRDFNSSP